MKVMPIRFVAGMESSARFCTALGLTAGDDSRSGNEAFGRSLRAADPDGVMVQINEHDRDLYT